jgi:hypothetical protein
MSIKLNSVGGGSVTIQEPNTASDFTLSVPARTGTTVLQDGSNNLLMNSGYGSDAVAYGCRAWVNFNGTGTVAIRASGNVSSITDNSEGNYTINFSTSLVDSNYCTVATGQNANATQLGTIPNIVTRATGSVRVSFQNGPEVNRDGAEQSIAVFR